MAMNTDALLAQVDALVTSVEVAGLAQVDQLRQQAVSAVQSFADWLSKVNVVGSGCSHDDCCAKCKALKARCDAVQAKHVATAVKGVVGFGPFPNLAAILNIVETILAVLSKGGL